MIRKTLTVTAVIFILFGFFAKDVMAQSDEDIIRKVYMTTITKKEIDIFMKWSEIMQQSQYQDSEDKVNKVMKDKYGVDPIDFYAIVYRILLVMGAMEHEDSDIDAMITLKDETGIEVSTKEVKLLRENYDEILAILKTQLVNY